MNKRKVDLPQDNGVSVLQWVRPAWQGAAVACVV